MRDDFEGKLIGRKRVMIVKYKCPCCGYYTLSDNQGNYEICPVCYWEDDPIQAEDEELEGGANKVSLAQARKNFIRFGACEETLLIYTRKPFEEEKNIPD